MLPGLVVLVRPRVCPDVKFYTKCAVLVLIYAVLSAHLCSYNLQQCDATPWTPLGELTALPQTSWLDFGERKRRGKGRGKGSGGKGKEKGTMEREGGGREMERKKKNGRMEREEFCAAVIFPQEKRGMLLTVTG